MDLQYTKRAPTPHPSGADYGAELSEKGEVTTPTEANQESREISTLADLLATLTPADRTDVIAGLPQDQRLAVARLLSAMIKENT